MKKQIKKILLTLVIIGVLGFIVYWATEMYQFAAGVHKDAHKIEQLSTKYKSNF